MACLYRRDRTVFTSYRRQGAADCPQQPPNASIRGWETFHAVTPVLVDQQPVGVLYIRRELGDMNARMGVGAATIVGLLLLATGAAFLTSARLQRSITTPLLQLADTARRISSSRDYSLRASPGSNDEIGVVIVAFNDMLDRIAEALERERAANRVKDEFLATLSHELRTPLNAVLGWTRLLRSSRLDKAMEAKALETIERNARVQAMLIEDLLDMSLIVGGKPRLHVREADLASIVGAALDVIQPAAAAKRLHVTVDIATRPAWTSGDAGRLQQVVWNLLSNAVKFTAEGGQIWIRLERANGYRLTVRDTGAGIDSTFLPRVFEPFRQGDGSMTRPYGGLGLGLTIAKQLAELHGGTIEAHSPGRDQGATFVLCLPSVLAAPHESVIQPSSVEALSPPSFDGTHLHGLHVLVVDDEEDARALLEWTLTQCGARVTTVASVADALAVVDRDPPDVLLSDIGMPDEDGYALIRMLRSRPLSKGGGIPAVAITAYASVKDGLAAEASGYQAHVVKPFEPSDVANLVALLARRTQTQP
jgi:signal transduction histidine kinase/ActR/RegA family two-component response regulator